MPIAGRRGHPEYWLQLSSGATRGWQLRTPENLQVELTRHFDHIAVIATRVGFCETNLARIAKARRQIGQEVRARAEAAEVRAEAVETNALAAGERTRRAFAILAIAATWGVGPAASRLARMASGDVRGVLEALAEVDGVWARVKPRDRSRDRRAGFADHALRDSIARERRNASRSRISIRAGRSWSWPAMIRARAARSRSAALFPRKHTSRV